MSDYTPPNAAPPNVTGGFGFTYADRVAARVMLAMLANEMLLGPSAGTPVELRFEQRPAGELFDDLVVVSDSDLEWALTVKSGDVVQSTRIDSDLLNRAWWMIENSYGDSQRTLLVIAQPPPTNGEHAVFRQLQEWAIAQDDGQVAAWLLMDDVGNAEKRALWGFLKAGTPERSPQNLLLRLRLLTLDLDPELGPDITSVRQKCETVLEAPDGWQELWNSLLQISSEMRGKAGYLTVDRIVRRLPSTILLRDQGETEEDLARLRAWGASYAPRNRLIGSRLSLDNTRIKANLEKAIAQANVVILSGESGVGKSVALAEWSEPDSAIYLRADVLSEPSVTAQRAGCRRNPVQILRLGRFRELRVVIDQIDRVEEDQAWAVLTSWINLFRADSRVVLIFGCASTAAPLRSAELERLLEQQPLEIPLERSADEILGIIRQEFTGLADVLQAYAPSPLLLTPRALDQLLKMSLEEWPTTFAKFLDLFWINRVQGGNGDPITRDAVKAMALHEAEKGIGNLPGGIDQNIYDRLLERALIQDDGERTTWDHDSTGDNIRTQMLREADENNQIEELLQLCAFNPMWRRALRLFCVSVMENESSAGFTRLSNLFLTVSEGSLLELSLFDAVVLCPPSMRMPNVVAPSLMQDQVRMKRYLARFQFTAARARTSRSAKRSEREDVYVRAYFRFPNWRLWLPTVTMVLENYIWFCENEMSEFFDVVEPYLEAPKPDGDFLEGARPALLVAYRFVRSNKIQWRRKDDILNKAFKVAIAALPYQQEAASLFLRYCAGRYGRELLEVDEREDIYPMFETFQRPLPLGPKKQRLSQFQKFFLASDWPRYVAKVDSELAKELFLACIVAEPGYGQTDGLGRGGKFGVSYDLSLPFSPATHQHPGLNTFFELSFSLGLDIVTTFIDFAVEQWLSQYDSSEPVGLNVHWKDENRFFLGDANVYRWESGGSVAPYVVQSFLLTLESQLLKFADMDELKLRVQETLEKTSNLAILSVLVSVAKANPQLLLDELAPVLFSREIDLLDIATSNDPSWHLMAGVWSTRDYWRDQDEQFRFSRLEHRKRLLRYQAIYYLLNGDPKLSEAARVRWLEMADGAEEEDAIALRMLAASYDRSKLEINALTDGRFEALIHYPPEVKSSSERIQGEMLENLRRQTLPMNAQKALGADSVAAEEASSLLADLRHVEQSGELILDLVSTRISVYLICLKAALAGFHTELGSVGECRQALLGEISLLKDSGKEPGFEDQYHWTSIVANHAPVIFSPGFNSPLERRATLAFIKWSTPSSFSIFLKSLRDASANLSFGVTLLEIGRVWAVERVRAQQMLFLRSHEMLLTADRQRSKSIISWVKQLLSNRKRITTAIDLDFEKKCRRFIRFGKWSYETGLVLSRRNENPLRKHQSTSDYISIVKPAMTLLANLPQEDVEPQLSIIVDDVVDAIGRSHEDDDHGTHYNEVWRIVGENFISLSPSIRNRFLSVWIGQIGDYRNEASELPRAILWKYGYEEADLEEATSALLEVVDTLRKTTGRWRASSLLIFFGIDRLGFNLDWSADRGGLWVTQHKALYAEMIPAILEDNDSTNKLLKRMQRSEFEPLYLNLFDALAEVPSFDSLIDENTAITLAEVMLAVATSVKLDEIRRPKWHSMLAALERHGVQLAWQVLAEVAERV